MAKAYGYYYDTNKQLTLCFACAVKEVVKEESANVSFQTTDHTFETCDKCGRFIDDSVDI